MWYVEGGKIYDAIRRIQFCEYISGGCKYFFKKNSKRRFTRGEGLALWARSPLLEPLEGPRAHGRLKLRPRAGWPSTTRTESSASVKFDGMDRACNALKTRWLYACLKTTRLASHRAARTDPTDAQMGWMAASSGAPAPFSGAGWLAGTSHVTLKLITDLRNMHPSSVYKAVDKEK